MLLAVATAAEAQTARTHKVKKNETTYCKPRLHRTKIDIK